jgi:hypothetical protein
MCYKNLGIMQLRTKADFNGGGMLHARVVEGPTYAPISGLFG